MEALLSFFGGILGGIRAAIGLVLPIFADAADFARWPGWLKGLIGLALIAAICAGLFFLQKALGLERNLQYAPETIRPFFLGILFLLTVAFSWLAYGLWRLLSADDDEAEFPDIVENWNEAVRRLAADGRTVGDAPLFLVLGRPAAGLDSLFLAAGVKDVIRTPAQGEPAIRVYAWDEAIFVVCPGASAWARFCMEVSAPPTADWQGQAGSPAGATLAPGAVFGGLDPMLKAEMEDLLRESSRRDLAEHEQARLRELADLVASAPAPVRKVNIPIDERSVLTRRLQFLCKVIARSRRPWCPLNGVLVLVPWGGTETDDAARVGCEILAQELDAAREEFRLRYPTYALVCDLETARGFEQFRAGFRAEMLKQRVGQRVPLVPVAKAEEIRGLVGSAARWIGLSVLPKFILQFLRLDAPDARKSPGSGSIRNRDLYLLMRAVFDRGPRLAELLAHGVPPVSGEDELAGGPMFGGIYLAATGRDEHNQAFVAGVFQRVIEGQNAVSWSPEAVAEDARLGRLAWLGYLGLTLLAAGAIAVAVWLTMNKPGTA